MKTRIIIWVASLVLIGALNVVADEKADSAAVSMRADIKRLMEITGAGNLSIQIMNRMMLTMRKGHKDVPEEFWDNFMAEIDPNGLIEIIIPIYEKHLTHEDIKQLIAFYESPIGKKLIKVQPQIMMDSMTAGEEWGKKLVKKVKKKLREEGE